MECRGGQTWVNLHVPPPRHPAAPAQFHRQPGPPQLRHRARRAAARKHAAEEAAQNTEYTEKVDTVQSAVAAAEAATEDIPPLQVADEEAADQAVQQQHRVPEQGVTLVSEYKTAVKLNMQDRDVPPRVIVISMIQFAAG